jgi:hypothetical protein
VAVPAKVVWSVHYHERIYEATPAPAGAAPPAVVPEGLGVAFEGSMLFHIAAAQSEAEDAARKAQVSEILQQQQQQQQ